MNPAVLGFIRHAITLVAGMTLANTSLPPDDIWPLHQLLSFKVRRPGQVPTLRLSASHFDGLCRLQQVFGGVLRSS